MSQFRNLVFEGGGVKGIAYAGAIKVLSEKNMIGQINRVGGASAGAITAALLSLGADWKDVREIVGGTNFNHFMDDSWGVVRDVDRLVNDYGWFKGDTFGKWMKKQIHAFTDNSELTFSDLENLKKENPTRFRSLYVVGTNLTLQIPQVFSFEHTPDMAIWYAVRVSMSIPLFFAAIKQNDEVLVDGGVTWNYPLDLFDDKEYISDPRNDKLYVIPDYDTTYGESHVYNKETLGFRVDTKDEIAAEKRNWSSPPQEIENFVDYAKALLGFLMDMANKAHLHKNDWHRTVFIDAKGVGTTDFNLPESKVKELVESGEVCTRGYFDWFDRKEETPHNRIT